MKFENTAVWGFEHAFRGMRNPKNSWHLSDSDFSDPSHPIIGDNDLKLAKALIKGGSEHRKFLRQIFVSVDITAPTYWWSEQDTYKVGTTANSTSTMHTIHTTPITVDCFETNDFCWDLPMIDDVNVGIRSEEIIENLEQLRQLYLMYKDDDPVLAKKYWKELIRWLPRSWLQMRTVTMTYENLYAIIRQRGNHKLNEWSGKDNPLVPNFIAWVHSLPCADELLFPKSKVLKQNTKVVCISGQARAGKDTFAEMVKQNLEEVWNRKVLTIHNADLLKHMCKTLFNWDGNKDESGRHILQYVGTDVVRKQRPDFWVSFIIDVLNLFPDHWDYVLIPDTRFPNEISELKKAGFDVTHIHITRNTENDLTDEQRNHPSETAMCNVVPDLTIENNSDLAALHRCVAHMTENMLHDAPEGAA